MYQHFLKYNIWNLPMVSLLIFFFFPQVVWVSGNPLSSEPGYRKKVIRKLQQIKKLDNIGELISHSKYTQFIKLTLA
jgi:hypothetical protein